MHIFVVEDETVIRQELRLLLENALYQVTVLDDFGDVASAVPEVNPDLVLLDLIRGCMKYGKIQNFPACALLSKV